MAKFISSASNEIFRKLLDLGSASGIRKHQQFLVMGEKIISENLVLIGSKIVAEIRTEAFPAKFPTALQWIFSPELFAQLDVIGTHSNLVLLDRPEIPKADLLETPQGLELILPLGDPSNLGAMARSAWAFGIKKIILTEESVTPYHPKALKASAGVLLKMQLTKTGKLESLPLEKLWALDMAGESLTKTKFPQNLRLLVGEEGPGLKALGSRSGLQKVISIPMLGVESLNATVAASIAIFEYQRQHSRQ